MENSVARAYVEFEKCLNDRLKEGESLASSLIALSENKALGGTLIIKRITPNVDPAKLSFYPDEFSSIINARDCYRISLNNGSKFDKEFPERVYSIRNEDGSSFTKIDLIMDVL